MNVSDCAVAAALGSIVPPDACAGTTASVSAITAMNVVMIFITLLLVVREYMIPQLTSFVNKYVKKKKAGKGIPLLLDGRSPLRGRPTV